MKYLEKIGKNARKAFEELKAVKHEKIKKALNEIKTSDNRSDNFDNKIIYRYLKEKFQLHSSNLDAILTKDQLRGRINDQDLDELIELLKFSDSFIYGKKETTDIHSLNQKTASILERIDKSC